MLTHKFAFWWVMGLTCVCHIYIYIYIYKAAYRRGCFGGPTSPPWGTQVFWKHVGRSHCSFFLDVLFPCSPDAFFWFGITQGCILRCILMALGDLFGFGVFSGFVNHSRARTYIWRSRLQSLSVCLFFRHPRLTYLSRLFFLCFVWFRSRCDASLGSLWDSSALLRVASWSVWDAPPPFGPMRHQFAAGC